MTEEQLKNVIQYSQWKSVTVDLLRGLGHHRVSELAEFDTNTAALTQLLSEIASEERKSSQYK